MKKYVLYTAVFGIFGKGRTHDVSTPNVDKICYTDLKNFTWRDYQVRKINLSHISPLSVRQQRYAKICIPDEIFNNYEYSIYVDLKHPIDVDFDRYASCLEPECDFATRSHRYKRRICVYEEGRVCANGGKGDRKQIAKQLDFYRSENYPTNNGLYATFIVFRRHTPRLKEFSKLWWEQIEKFSHRDQISLPYVAWKCGMEISLCGKAR